MQSPSPRPTKPQIAVAADLNSRYNPPQPAAASPLSFRLIFQLEKRGDRERFLQAGMDHYLAKPFSFDELRNAIDRAIESRDETRPRREDPPDRSAAAET